MNTLLARFGINPRHYWLLIDLFGQLSERREILGHLGRDAMTLKTMTWMYFAMSSSIGIVMSMGRV